MLCWVLSDLIKIKLRYNYNLTTKDARGKTQISKRNTYQIPDWVEKAAQKVKRIWYIYSWSPLASVLKLDRDEKSNYSQINTRFISTDVWGLKLLDKDDDDANEEYEVDL